MRPAQAMPASIVRRAAAVARGPHACPSCGHPTWTEPPANWSDLRDYVARCERCERPVVVATEPARLARASLQSLRLLDDPRAFDPQSELLDRMDPRAFFVRVAVAGVGPAGGAALVAAAGGSANVATAVALALVVPSSLFAPGLVAQVRSRLVALWLERTSRGRTGGRSITVLPGRWEAWRRELVLRGRSDAGSGGAASG